MKKYNNYVPFTEIQKEYLNADKPSLPFVICTFGDYVYQNRVSRQEGYQYHHILWVTKGRGIFDIDGQHFSMSEGEGVFFKRNVSNHYRADGDVFGTAWLTFTCHDSVLDYFRLPDVYRFNVTPKLITYANDLNVVCGRNSTVIERSSVAYSGFVEWMSSLTKKDITLSEKTKQYLESHFFEPLTLEDVAAATDTDKFVLCRTFKNETDLTVMEQLKKIRIAKAKQMLRYTQYKIEDIGKMCGFESASYFGKLFKNESGYTPKQYRETRGG